jgi:hypothetical protein
MHVEMRDIATIQPYPGNPRRNDHAVAEISSATAKPDVDGGHAATAEHPEDLVARKGGRVLHRRPAVRARLAERGDSGTEQ